MFLVFSSYTRAKTATLPARCDGDWDQADTDWRERKFVANVINISSFADIAASSWLPRLKPVSS
jgi:hypothetical protein